MAALTLKLTVPAESLFKLLAQLLSGVGIFGAVIYAGATEETTQWGACLVVLVALVCVLLSITFRSPPPTVGTVRQPGASLSSAKPAPVGVVRLGGGRTTALVIFVWMLFLVWTAAAVVRLPPGLVESLSPASAQLRSDLIHPDSTASAPSTVAVIPQRTIEAWPPIAIGLGCFLIGATAFPSRSDRRRLLAAVVVGGCGFAAWGLINRSKGLNQLLPGVDAPENAQPFSTLIYKNAGGALLILIFAVAVGMLLEALRPAIKERSRRLAKEAAKRREGESSEPRHRRSSAKPTPGSGYSHRGAWTEPGVFGMLAVLALLVVAIAFSLSRGTWIVSAIAILTWMAALRRWFTPRAWVVGAIVLSVLLGMAAWGLGNRSAVADRFATLLPGSTQTGDRLSHYQQALSTLLEFPVTGAGLGNYGFVQLLGQQSDTPRWFEHAHSMPIEWMVETGVPGIALVLLGLFAGARLIQRLYRRRFESSSFVVSFSVALIASIGLALQSLFDFTLLTPAVLWAYAIVLGAMLATSPRTGGRARPMTTDHANSKSKFAYGATRPSIWIILTGVFLLVAQVWLQRSVVNDRMLAGLRVPVFNLVPSQQRIDGAIEMLEKQLASSPHHAALHRRLSQWKTAQYRRSLVDLAAENGEPVNWNDTMMTNVFQSYYRTPSSDRDATLAIWKAQPGSEAMIGAAVESLDRSIAANPLIPQSHLDAIMLAPLSGREIGPSFRAAEDASMASGQLQYRLGWVAFWTGQDEAMKDHWRRALLYAPELTGPILDLASDRLSPQEISESILTSLRPSVWLSLIRGAKSDPTLVRFADAFETAAIASFQNREGMSAAARAFYTGRVHEILDRSDLAAKEYVRAVEADRSNGEYRQRAAMSLWRSGDLAGARQQLVMAEALDGSDERVAGLLRRLDEQMKRRSEKAAPPTAEELGGNQP